MIMLFLFLLINVACSTVIALDNGLALTPPMGWLAWEAFGCNTDCDNDPDYCISEKLIMQMADHLAEDGYRDVGYEYVCIDDCWSAPQRDVFNQLQPDPKRFPSGMKHLADYVHSKGLKLGIYGDFGTKTCAGYPGSEFYLEKDAKTFAEWGIDLLKFDTCNSDAHDNKYGYPAMAMYLNQTNRPILFSCEWPYGELQQNLSSDYGPVHKYCNIYRNFWDVNDDFGSVKGIIDYYGKNNAIFRNHSGPGGFLDPDMVLVGGFGLSDNSQRSQMAMWAMFSAPLLMSNDLRAMPDKARQLAQNKLLISVDQDPLGAMATKLWEKSGVQVWVKPMSPKGSVAVTILNTNKASGFSGTHVEREARTIGMTDSRGYTVTEVFTGKNLGKFTPESELKTRIFPFDINGLQAWVKPITPQGSVAVTFFNTESHSGTPVNMNASGMGMTDPRGYMVTEVFTGKSLGKFLPNMYLKFRVFTFDSYMIICQILS